MVRLLTMNALSKALCAMGCTLAFGAAVVFATPPVGTKPPELARDRVPAILLKPLPAKGAVPYMVPPKKPLKGVEAVKHAAAIEGYSEQFRALKSKHFGSHTGVTRTAGLTQLRSFSDAQSLEPMWAALGTEQDDVRLAVMDHLARQGATGQGTLAKIAIYAKEAPIRAEATRRIQMPPAESVLQELDTALRANEHETINNAGLLAGSIHAIEAIPALIFAQFSQDNAQAQGDLAWIAIGTRRSYVQNLIPVTGDNSGAFNPVIGQIIEGVVMRVADCIVTTYRADVHNSLIAMSSFDTGTDMAARLDWDMRGWAKWFNEEYVPMKQREDEQLAKAQAAADAQTSNATGGSTAR